MIYTSKRRTFRDFFKTGNMKYYIAFALVFLVIVTSIVFFSIKKGKTDNSQGGSNQSASIAGSDETLPFSDTDNARGQYRLVVYKESNLLVVYAYDRDNEAYYTTPSQIMWCSVFSGLSAGLYKADKDDFKKNTWNTSSDKFIRYETAFGDVLSIHSAQYDVLNDKNSLNVSDYSTIGHLVNSQNGITVFIKDAKWIYENCSYLSEVEIVSDVTTEYSDSLQAPIIIPDGITWEPTDVSTGTPWCPLEISRIDVATSITVDTTCTQSDILSHIKAYDKNNNDISSYVFLTGNYDLDKAGEYEVLCNLIDTSGNILNKQFTLIVEEVETESETDETTETESDEEEETTSSKTDSIENSSEVQTETSAQETTSADLETTKEDSENVTTASETVIETTTETITDDTTEGLPDEQQETTTQVQRTEPDVEPEE